MHNGMVEADAAKMSKSEGNIFQLSEALDRYGREAVVIYLISGHYRQPLAFGSEEMEQAVARVERLRNFFREHPVGQSGEGPSEQQRGGSDGPSPDCPPARRLESFERRSPMTSIRRGRWPRSSSWSGEANRGRSPGPPRPFWRCSSCSGSTHCCG